MMRTAILTPIFLFAFTLTGSCLDVGLMSKSVPMVAYLEPASGSHIDLSGKDKLIFRWNMVPIPAGGREVYRFTLYKGDGYDVVVNQTLDPDVFSTEINTNLLEAGVRYRWQVKQRDARSMDWSRYDSWYFIVVKK